jgi:hypothetical protein
MTRSLLTLCVFGLLVACGRTPNDYLNRTLTPTEIANGQEAALCGAFAQTRQAAIRQELTRREVVTAEEWTVIDTGHPSIGSRPIVVVCTLGIPANATKAEDGSSMRYEYQDGRVVTFSNGVVTTIAAG